MNYDLLINNFIQINRRSHRCHHRAADVRRRCRAIVYYLSLHIRRLLAINYYLHWECTVQLRLPLRLEANLLCTYLPLLPTAIDMSILVAGASASLSRRHRPSSSSSSSLLIVIAAVVRPNQCKNTFVLTEWKKERNTKQERYMLCSDVGCWRCS